MGFKKNRVPKGGLSIIFSSILILLLFTGISGAFKVSGKVSVEGKGIDELMGEASAFMSMGRPKSAMPFYQKVEELALSQKRYDTLLTAMCRRIVLEANILGNKPAEKIKLIENEIDKAPEKVKALMIIVQANWYWHYYQRNRWRFNNRSETLGLDDKDFTTWDLPKLFNHIDSLYQKALVDKEILKKIKCDEFYDFLNKGSANTKEYRPTMYDFAVFSAIDFYQAGDQIIKKPEDAFEIPADSDALAPAQVFCSYKPETEDTDSPKYKALVLFQDILKFHDNDDNRAAYADADLSRLKFIKAYAFGSQKNERYEARLREISREYSNHRISAYALSMLASEYSSREDYITALELAKQGLKAFPDSPGGALCHNSIVHIQSKNLTISTEYSVISHDGQINIQYKNIDKLYFRIYKDRWDKFMENDENWNYPDVTAISDKETRHLLSQEPVAEWNVKLKPTDDFKERTKSIDMPVLKKGFYRVMASWKEDFGNIQNAIRVCPVWVTDISLVVRTYRKEYRGFVLDAYSGEPREGALVKAYQVKNNTGKVEIVETTKTNSDGIFIFSGKRNSLYFEAEFEDSRIFINNSSSTYDSFKERSNSTSHIFTDRSLYRPGQAVHFKVFSYSCDHKNDKYECLTNHTLSVSFRDANNQKIDSMTIKTNEFGSASGVFTAPSKGLTGAMRIVVTSPRASATVRVEEYKRPKFRVTVDTPENEVKLGEKITVKGKAMAYTGAPIDGAKVKYRVTRQARFPWWCWWRSSSSNSMEITHGTVKTDPDGTFEIDFLAHPDKLVDESDDPTFTYTVNADVIDSTGETRSGSAFVNLAYRGMDLNVSTPDFSRSSDAITISVNSTNIQGKPLASNGTTKIYTLLQPIKPQKEPLQSRWSWWRPRKYDPMGSDDTVKGYDWKTWKVNQLVESFDYTAEKGVWNTKYRLEPGAYRIVAESKDSTGKDVKAVSNIMVVDTESKEFAVKIPDYFKVLTPGLQPGNIAEILWGTGYGSGRAYVEYEHRGKIFKSFWTSAQTNQNLFKILIEDKHRGGLTVHITSVKENRCYTHDKHINVPWDNKKLKLSFETFRSKLQPGQKETWTLKITGPENDIVPSELAAALYDASLDAFYAHSWNTSINFRNDRTYLNSNFANFLCDDYSYKTSWGVNSRGYNRDYVRFPNEVLSDFMRYAFPNERLLYSRNSIGGVRSKSMRKMSSSDELCLESAPMAMMDSSMSEKEGSSFAPQMAKKSISMGMGGKNGDAVSNDKSDTTGNASKKLPDLDKVQARKNLNETAFFFPHIKTDNTGIATMTFTIPEALTEWKFLGFANTKDLMTGLITNNCVTQKDLMVQPNPPRFLREGDVLEFTAKVTNMSDKEATGQIKLALTDASTDKNMDSAFENDNNKQNFSIPAKRSRTISWRLKVPNFTGTLVYKVVAATDTHSDGEENYLPVLSRRVFVTESMPLPIRGQQKKVFKFKKLLESGSSDTLENKVLTLQVVSNPAWYAVQALPYLMEFPHECSEQLFNRIYANSLASHIADSNPRIRRIFDQWKNTKALDSNLEKNESLKSVALEDTPWVRAAQSESQSKRRIGLLFDDNHMKDSLKTALEKLVKRQRSDGSWGWFPGAREGNFYITLYIATGFARLEHLGVKIDMNPGVKSLDFLDEKIKERYDYLKKKGHLNSNNLTSRIAMYLYARSFYMDRKAIPDQNTECFNYYLGQADKYWLSLDSRMSHGHLALACHRLDHKDTANNIFISLKERSVNEEEMGMYWQELELSWWWYRAPIETQAMMIEVFDEIADDEKAVEDMKVWLIKQKQTQNWKTTKATADAVYALLLRGDDLLSSTELVRSKLGDMKIIPENVEAGTGFYEKKIMGSEISPSYGKIELEKVDKGVAWGSIHWQYMEDMSKVTPHKTPLSLEKSIFVTRETKKGPVIEEVKGALEVGDLIKVRVVLRVDRDMEYIHLKDYRGSGTEPVNVLSQYKYQDGLAYYEANKDTATHFFIDYLPKGTYVFEYPLRIQHKGYYQMGMAQIQCMYAPEFNSHSESFFIDVK